MSDKQVKNFLIINTPYKSRVKSGQVVAQDHVVDVLDIPAGSRVAVFLDLYKVLVGICLTDQVVVAGPVFEQELEVSLYAFLHRVKDTEVRGDRCVMSGCIFLAGEEVYALSGPKCSALETEEVVVFFAEARFTGSALKDCLSNDGADDSDVVLRSVFYDQRRDALDKLLRVAVGISGDSKGSAVTEVIPCAINMYPAAPR